MGSMWEVRKRVKIWWIWLLSNIIISYILIRYTWLGSVWSIIGLFIGWGIIAMIVLKFIHKTYAFTIDYKFLIKNIILTAGLSAIFYSTKNQFFVLENYMRYRNILTIGIYLMIFISIIWVANYKQILLVLREIKKFRK